MSFFALKIFSKSIFICPINLPKICKFPSSNCSGCSVMTQNTLHKKWSFLSRISSVNVTNPQFPVDLVIFTGEILNGKLHFLYSNSKFLNLRRIWLLIPLFEISKMYLIFDVFNLLKLQMLSFNQKKYWIFGSERFLYIWLKHSDICSSKLDWQYLCRF